MPYINTQGNYYEGDRQGDDLEVPQRPDATHKPSFNEDGSFNSWVIDIDEQATTIENKYQAKFDACDQRILAILKSGGDDQVAKLAEVQATYATLSNEKDAETLGILGANK